MLRKIWFKNLTKLEISKLRGGRKHNFRYYVGISELSESIFFTDVTHPKLLNQMATQESRRFEDGYEPFQGCYGVAKFCLKTMTITVPRLKLVPAGWPSPTLLPRIVKERKPACVLDVPARSTEASKMLEVEAMSFEVRQRIRCHAAHSPEKLELVTSLMAYSAGPVPICPDPTDRFEAYLAMRSLAFLQDLLALLDMPDPPSKPAELGLPQAA
jgi:hypothetical protein